MRVLFVFPDLSSTVTHYTGVLNYGIGALTAMLRREGHDVSLLHLTAAPGEDEFRARVQAAAPDLVAFSANSHYARRLRTWTRWAREAARVPVVVGGVHATLAPDAVEAIPQVSFVCVGEGDHALPELCAALVSGRDPSGIANLRVRGRNGFTRNSVRPIVADLDDLPDPDLTPFDVQRLYNVRRGTFTYVMSRGCAYGCTYCCVHSLRAVSGRARGYWRFLSPERAADQLAHLIRRHMPDAADVSFVDAILFPDREWLEAFAPLYRERVGLPFACNMRADRVDAGVAATLKAMGCRTVRFGVESGDPVLTRDVLRRGLDIEDIRRAFALLRAHGIERWSYNMVGLPRETLPRALQTVKLNAELAPELALAFMFFPYPGTELHRLCREHGWLTHDEFDHYQAGAAVRLPGFPRPDVVFVHRWFRSLVRTYAMVRRVPPPLGTLASKALDATLASPLLPRAAMVRASDGWRMLRHAFGERLVERAPRLYRALGGRDPAGAPPHHAAETAG